MRLRNMYKFKNTICLTERTFIGQVNDEYYLESELQIYVQF